MDETRVILGKCEEIVEVLREVAMAKCEHGRKWGSDRKQGNLKTRGEV